MTSSISRIAAALLGAAIVSATFGGKAALAQTATSATCPCLTGALVDSWFNELRLVPGQPKQLLACVDDPGFTTFDYLDRTEERRAIYVDVTAATSGKAARCLFTVSRATGDLAEARTDITPEVARACRMEIVNSQTWQSLRCPNN